MKKIILLLAICIWLLSSCKITSPSENEVTAFQIINRTDTTFNKLNIKEAGKDKWDQSHFGDYTPGTHEIYLYRYLDNQLRYDIQLEQTTGDKKTATLYNIQIFENAYLEYDYKDFDDESSMHVTTLFIYNLTGRVCTGIAIGEGSSGPWRIYNDAIHIPIDATYELNIDQNLALDRTKLYRIRLSIGTQSAEKINEPVWQNKTITFRDTDFN